LVVQLKLEIFAMEFFSAAWWSALLAIVLIDLLLAGDNAIVIALAARQLPPHLQKRVILWGTVGAIGVRTLMTIGAVYLLRLPGLMLIGGLGLLWLAYKLLDSSVPNAHDAPAVDSFGGAIKTILVADALMGIDNVLGVAGAAHGALDLVIIGLLVSVPIVVFGSTVVLKLVQRFPQIIQIGAAVLAITAARMISHDVWLVDLFGTPAQRQEWPFSLVQGATYAVAVIGVWLASWWRTRQRTTKQVLALNQNQP
jgi:YjbE family integral membrane protein